MRLFRGIYRPELRNERHDDVHGAECIVPRYIGVHAELELLPHPELLSGARDGVPAGKRDHRGPLRYHAKRLQHRLRLASCDVCRRILREQLYGMRYPHGLRRRRNSMCRRIVCHGRISMCKHLCRRSDQLLGCVCVYGSRPE